MNVKFGAEGRIYVNLGDPYDVNFKNTAHMGRVRDTYKEIVARGLVPGSLTFTPKVVGDCKRRLIHLIDAIAEVRRLKEQKRA